MTGREAPAWLAQANTRETLYLVNRKGETAAIPVHAVPESDDPGSGLLIEKISALDGISSLAYLFTLPPKEQLQSESVSKKNVLTVTENGMLKKTSVSELPGPSAGTFTLVRVNDGDTLKFVRLTQGNDEILMMSSRGMAIRFSEDDVRPMGLVAAGVMGMKLMKGDIVVGAEVLPQPGEVFMIASDGIGKRVAIKDFPTQGRYGQGVQAWKLPDKIYVVGMTVGRGSSRIIVLTSRLAPKPLRLDSAQLLGRTARGKPVIELKTNNRITGINLPLRRFFK